MIYLYRVVVQKDSPKNDIGILSNRFIVNQSLGEFLKLENAKEYCKKLQIKGIENVLIEKWERKGHKKFSYVGRIYS